MMLSTLKKGLKGFLSVLNNTGSTLKLLWKIDKRLSIGVFVLQLLSNLDPIAQAYLIKLLVDTVVNIVSAKSSPQIGLPNIINIVLLLWVLNIMSSSLNIVSSALNQALSEKLLNNVNYRILEIANKLQVKYFEDPQFYDRYEKVRRNSGRRPLNVLSSIITISGQLVVGVSFLILILSFNPLVFVALFISTLPLFIYDSFLAKKIYFVTEGRVPESRLVNYLSGLLFSDFNIKELRVLGLHNYFYKLYKDVTEKFYKENVTIQKNQAAKRLFLLLIYDLAYFASYLYIAIKALFSIITLGSFTLYSTALSRISSSIRGIFSGLSDLYENNLYLSDLFEFFNFNESSFERRGTIKLGSSNLEIRLENVSFKYPGTHKLVLKDLNMVIRPGESVAIVGRNGAGKTTLVKLLCGFYEPTKGKILINSIPLEKLDLEEYRKLLGIMFQDFCYYHFSAAENIGFGKLQELHNKRKIVEASKKSGAHTFIDKFPYKYDQQIGKLFDKGVGLSIGQFQKLALARVFMSSAPLMILDEPTASADAEAELSLFKQIEQFSKDKALLLISHRFSTVRISKKIYVIDDGKIIEEGSHKELLKRKGLYSRLYNIQAQGYKGS